MAMSINSVGNYGYYPHASNYRANVNPNQTELYFAGGIHNPEQNEQVKKSSKRLFKTILLGTVAVVGYLAYKGKFNGLFNKFKGLFNTTKEVTTQTVKNKKVKLKAQKAIVSEHVSALASKKYKMKNAGGKEAIRKIRRQEKKIIQAAMEAAEAEKITAKDIAAYRKSLGKPATVTERAYMSVHNKPAAESVANIVEANGLKVIDGQLVKPVAETAAKVTPKVAKAATPGAEVLEMIEECSKLKDKVAKYSKPGMEKWAKPYVEKLAKLEEKLHSMNIVTDFI